VARGPSRHKTKDVARGIATRWQGYLARLGLGTTLIRTQISAAKPINGNNQVGCDSIGCSPTILPVLGHVLKNFALSFFILDRNPFIVNSPYSAFLNLCVF
jgi:hypothetical protein